MDISHRHADEAGPSFTSQSESLPTLQDLKEYLQSKEAAADTDPKQNQDAQAATDDCDVEKTCDNISNPASKPMHKFELGSNFKFNDKSLIGRFPVKSPTLEELSQWSRENWETKLQNTWRFQIIGEGFFKIEFFSEADGEFVLKNGPWFFGVEGLGLKRWSPDFDTQSPGQLKTPVWIRILKVPLKLSMEDLIVSCVRVGKVLKVEWPAKEGSYLSKCRVCGCSLTSYRVCLEVDLSEGLPVTIKIVRSGVINEHKLVYEGLPLCPCTRGSKKVQKTPRAITSGRIFNSRCNHFES